MRRGVGFCILLALPGSLRAQDNSGQEEIAALRAGFFESIAAGDRSVHRQFAEALAAEEKAWASGGDYAAAARLRALREGLLSKAGTADGRPTFTMDVTTSRNKGSGLAAPEGGHIKFASSSAFLEWELNGEFKGWYEVLLTHGVEGRGDSTAEIKPLAGPPPVDRKPRNTDEYSAPKTGGWVGFEKISTLDHGGALHREIVSTGGWNTMRRVSLGRMELSGNSLRCRLIAREALPEGLMNFKMLELVPSAAPAGGGADGERELDENRKKFETAFKAGTVELNKTYLDNLNRMAAQQKDPDLLARIKLEIDRMENPAKLAFTADEDSGLGQAIKLIPGSGIDWKLSGDVRLDGSKKYFTTLRPPGKAAIAWKLAAFNVPSGTYSVVVKGRVPVNGGGTAAITATGTGGISGKALTFKVDPVVTPANRSKKPENGSSPPQPESRTIDADGLVIPKGSEYLTLTVQSLTHEDGSLLDISSITLDRTGDVPAPKTP